MHNAATIDLVGEHEARCRVHAALFGGRMGGPTRIGRYHILEQLGSGGVGVVYGAYDPRLDRKVAIKLLRRRVASDPDGRARFFREAQALAKLAHPNVIAVHDAGVIERDHGGPPEAYIAMEYAEGETLARWLERAPSPAEILRAFVDAGRGLAAVHAAGLVHRDFKPSNVLVSADRGDRQSAVAPARVRVIDFGLARLVDHETLPRSPTPTRVDIRNRAQALGSPVTMGRGVLGTLAYMAPEQLEGRPIDARADQFAFCVALFEALHHRRPFIGSSIAELLAAIQGGEHGDSRDAGTPTRVRAALWRGLSASPARRFPDMDALLAELAPRTRGRPTWWLAGSIATAFAAAGAFGLVHRQSDAARCAAAADSLAGIWDDDVKARAQAAFAATERPYASHAWNGARQALDRYAIAWVEQSTETCAETLIDHTQSAPVHELRTACLTEVLDELAALTDLFTRADAAIVGRAVMAAHGLTEAGSCAAEQVVRRSAAHDPASRSDLERARRLSAQARANWGAGVYEDSRRLGREAATIAETLDEPALLAQAMLIVSEAELALGQSDASERSLHVVLGAAARAQRDELSADALTGLASVVGFELGRAAEGLAFAVAAEAALVRSGDGPSRRARLHRIKGLILKQEASFEAAREQVELALALVDDGDMLRILLEHDLGSVLKDLGQYAQARRHLGTARAAAEALLGPGHPQLATHLNNLGNVAVRAGDPFEARELLTEALAILVPSLPSAHRWAVQTRCNLADAEIELGALADARAHLERAEADVDGSANPRLALSVASVRAKLELAAGDAARALDVVGPALRRSEVLLGPERPPTIELLRLRAASLHRLGHTSSARAALGDARERARAAGHASTLIRVELDLGELEIDAGRLDAARSVLDDALARVGQVEADPSHLARLRFGLARAMWPDEATRPRALALAQQAVETLEHSDHRASQRTGMIEWLAAHALR